VYDYYKKTKVATKLYVENTGKCVKIYGRHTMVNVAHD
jgi:hypothetical protein